MQTTWKEQKSKSFALNIVWKQGWTFSRTGTYSTEAFNKFPFNREAAAKVHSKDFKSIHTPVHMVGLNVIPGSQRGLIGQMGWVGRCHGSAWWMEGALLKTYKIFSMQGWESEALWIEPWAVSGAHWWISVNSTEEEAVQVSFGPNIPFQIPGYSYIEN